MISEILVGATGAFIGNILSHLTERVAEAGSRKWQRILKGDEGHQALERCLSAGLVTMLGYASGATTMQRDQLDSIFGDFFDDEAVSHEIAQLLRGNRLDQEELTEIFYELGYDETTLPGLNFEQAITLFEVGFLTAVSEEPLFQPRIQAVQLIQQTRILKELLDEIRTMVSILREVGHNDLQIGAGVVTTPHRQLGAQQFLLAAPPDNQLDRHRRAYLNYLFTTLRKLSLSGIDPAAKDSKAQLQLDGVYTALLTSSNEQYKHLSALAQLDEHSRLVLTGDPGSGKSTFVNYVALCLAGEALGKQVNLNSLTAPLPKKDGEDEEVRQPWQHEALLPVPVVLRDFAARGLPDCDQPITASCLWDFIKTELKINELAEFEHDLKDALDEGQALLLLDGLDEVPEANERRAQIKEAIISFTNRFPCRVLLTSRTYAYEKPEWKLPDFEEAKLADFSDGQIKRFVKSWYKHLATQRPLNEENAEARARLLQEAIDRNERLQELAKRPLLLTLMASLHAWRGGNLPEKREELYAEAVDLLFHGWENQRFVINKRGEKERQPSFAELLKVGKDKVREVLNKLAFEAHKSQPKMIGTADIPQMRLIEELLDISRNRKIQLLELTHYLEHRAGLLLARGEKVYTFPHRTFQEYLAACYLADGDPAEIAELACQEPNRWREVVLLAGAKVASGSKWQIWSCVDALCHTDVEHTKERLANAWAALFAGQLLIESADLSNVSKVHQPKLERVQKWQRHILCGDTLPAVERVLAGNTLAELGDPRFLADKWYLPNESLLGFVEVQGGPFMMGSVKEQEPQADDDESPLHETLPIYWIARYPVIVAQWRAFVKATDHKPVDTESLKGIVNHPVRSVSWDEATDYCEWLQQKLKKEAEEWVVKGAPPEEREFWGGLWSGSLKVTLPSEAEWEKAARGTDGRTYPWGEKTDPERANYDETGIGGSTPVGAFAAGVSPYGCEEMSGNLWEWTRIISEETSDNTAHRIVRGGSFADSGKQIHCCATRNALDPHDNIGWRVVVSP